MCITDCKNIHHCTIKCGGKVVATGTNRRGCIIYNGKVYGMHAEVVALLKLPLDKRSKKLVLIVYREGLKLSKPCEDCLNFMRETGFNIKTIQYSADGSFIKEQFADITNDHSTLYWRGLKAHSGLDRETLSKYITNPEKFPEVPSNLSDVTGLVRVNRGRFPK
jgi:cytidine deaminase